MKSSSLKVGISYNVVIDHAVHVYSCPMAGTSTNWKVACPSAKTAGGRLSWDENHDLTPPKLRAWYIYSIFAKL